MTNGSQRFAGTTAVVTGGASGIGFAITRRLLAEGASVACSDINAERLHTAEKELAAGGRAVFVQADEGGGG